MNVIQTEIPTRLLSRVATWQDFRFFLKARVAAPLNGSRRTILNINIPNWFKQLYFFFSSRGYITFHGTWEVPFRYPSSDCLRFQRAKKKNSFLKNIYIKYFDDLYIYKKGVKTVNRRVIHLAISLESCIYIFFFTTLNGAYFMCSPSRELGL